MAQPLDPAGNHLPPTPGHSPIAADDLRCTRWVPAPKFDLAMHTQTNCIRKWCTKSDGVFQVILCCSSGKCMDLGRIEGQPAGWSRVPRIL
jgi:hypothetical protein